MTGVTQSDEPKLELDECEAVGLLGGTSRQSEGDVK